jgi:phospholipase C
MHTTGTIDPDGSLGGGPVIDNTTANGALKWETYAERLQGAGIDWYVYQEEDNNGDNMLVLFESFVGTNTEIYRRRNSFIPTPKGQIAGPALFERLRQDVHTGNLPQVSWIFASFRNCEDPAASPAGGAAFTAGVLNALMSDPKVWAKTVLLRRCRTGPPRRPRRPTFRRR